MTALLVAVLLSVDDECILNQEVVRGQLDHHAKGVQTVAAPVVKDHNVHEAVRLSDGTVVTLDYGGCAHYGFRLEWSKVKRKGESDAAAAKALLLRTPFHKDAESYLAQVRGFL